MCLGTSILDKQLSVEQISLVSEYKIQHIKAIKVTNKQANKSDMKINENKWE